jgi:Flp pilus assembly protein TadG
MSPKTSFYQKEGGQALIVTAFCLFCVLGFVALATDVGMLFRDKVNLQKVADDAAIAGAAQLSSGSYIAAAQDSAAQNGVTNGVNGTVTVTLGTTYHPNAVSVSVSQAEATHFLGLFGLGAMTVAAQAAAGITNGNGCMFALDQNPFKSQGISMNGTGNVNVPNCSIYDNSGLTMNGNSGSITAKFIGVAGSYSGSGATPTPVTGMVPVPDPMAYWNTPPAYGSCAKDPNLSKGSVGPGCYDGLTLSGSATMSPGLYIIGGALNVTGITATGVTFYIDGTKGGTFGSVDGSNLTAPTSGTPGTCTSTGGCNGMLIWDTESTGKAQQGVSFGPHGSTLTGILYFPNASLKFHGDTTTTLNADIIAQSYVFDGTIGMNNYVLSAGQSPLFMTPTLLE